MTKQQYLIHLIKSAITQTEAELPSGDFEWTEFAAYAEQQQFEHILFPLLKDKGIENIDERTWYRLRQRYGKAVRRDSIQDLDLEEISYAFSEKSIAHIPLKGSVVKHYYPLPDLRRSSDFDILIHDEDRLQARNALSELGYVPESEDQIMDDSYWKNKNHLELHVMLMPPNTGSHMFLNKVWEYSVPESDSRYVMQPEFLYVYLLAHLHRHLMCGGGGIKLITDFWVLRNSIELDEDLIGKFAKDANLSNLYHCTTELVEKWFNDVPCTNEYTLLIEQLILSGGAYGDYEVSMKMKFSDKRNSRARNFIRMAFPTAKHLSVRYPVLEKYPYLLPVIWVRRFLDFKGYNPKVIIKAANDSGDAEVLSDFVKYVSK